MQRTLLCVYYVCYVSPLITQVQRVRRANYGPTVLRLGHENKEGSKRGFVTGHTDRANDYYMALFIISGKERNYLTF